MSGLVGVALLCVGCIDNPPGPAATESPATSAPASRYGPLGGLTAHGVVEELANEGFETLNPVDTTRQECPAAGCDQSVVTDRLRIKSFPSTGQAQIYAADHDMRQVGTLVVSFAESVPQAEQDRYWNEIVKLVR